MKHYLLMPYNGILYNTHPDPDLQKKRTPDLMKKQTLYQNSLYELRTHFWQIWGCWFQIWQYYFQIPVQKYPNQAFLVPNLGIFVSLQNFAMRQIQGSDFKYDNSFLNFKPKKTQTRHFYFFVKFCNLKNSRVLIWKRTIIFWSQIKVLMFFGEIL